MRERGGGGKRPQERATEREREGERERGSEGERKRGREGERESEEGLQAERGKLHVREAHHP
jgi:hypothetical protein